MRSKTQGVNVYWPDEARWRRLRGSMLHVLWLLHDAQLHLYYLSVISYTIALYGADASSVKRNATACRLSVFLSVPSAYSSRLTRGIMPRGQHAFRPDNRGLTYLFNQTYFLLSLRQKKYVRAGMRSRSPQRLDSSPGPESDSWFLKNPRVGVLPKRGLRIGRTGFHNLTEYNEIMDSA